MARPLWVAVLIAACAEPVEPVDPGPVPDAPDAPDAPEAPEPSEPGPSEIGLPGDTPELPSEPAEDTGAPAVASSAPTCGILAPEDGAAFPSGTAIRFVAEVADADDDLGYVLWRSDTYGTMVLGTDFTFILPAGAHRVSVTAVDDAGQRCVDEVTITVGPADR